ncbi:MAG: hypothetical protein ACREEM_13295 [Blastocatellia bacterium]
MGSILGLDHRFGLGAHAARVSKNGHILPYVHFVGGSMSLAPEALEILRELPNAKN